MVGAPDQQLSMAQNWGEVDQVPMGVLNKIQYDAQGVPLPSG